MSGAAAEGAVRDPGHDPQSDPLREELRALFAAGGALAGKIDGWAPRAQQLEMAVRVAAALREQRVLVCEAGTGTGKTLAYMIPALLHGGKVIVSTGTKTLQDQLFHRDLPLARAALAMPLSVALLKGRANYVCLHHLERNAPEARLSRREEAGHLRLIERFAKTTRSGDRAELAEVPDDSGAWGWATSSRDNCLGQKCGHFDACFVMKARREAINADVVVVNHHLFFADLVLRDEGVGELLPACNTVILDEAHQLAETATLFFGESVSTAQAVELSRDARAEIAASCPELPQLDLPARALERAGRDLRIVLGADAARRTNRLPAVQLEREKGFRAALSALEAAANGLADALDPLTERAEGLERIVERARALSAALARWSDPDAPPPARAREYEEAFGEAPRAASAAAADVLSAAETGSVRWGEIHAHSLTLHSSPLSVAGVFRAQIDGRPRAWVFTSATLAVGGDFSHFTAQLGLGDAQTARWDSPFDYANHSRLLLPRGLPDPGSPAHTEAVVNIALPLIRASGGAAMLLFTTLRALRLARELLAERFAREGLKHALLAQGEASRRELLERFRREGDAVLLGAASFWEGIDVRGDALRLLMIDKLPFAPPDDPVVEERLARIERAGGNAFMSWQLPQAAIALKQGAGRLIRDDSDRGLLAILDPRLGTKPYGRRLIASLPPMPVIRDIEQAAEFLRATRPEQGRDRPATA